MCTFNWSNAPPDVQRQLGDDYLPGPHAPEQAYQEVGSADTLRFKDKTFTIDPRVCQQGENRVRIRLRCRTADTGAGQVIVEKLEIHLQFIEAPRSM